jgi:hypothetical protein
MYKFLCVICVICELRSCLNEAHNVLRMPRLPRNKVHTKDNIKKKKEQHEQDANSSNSSNSATNSNNHNSSSSNNSTGSQSKPNASSTRKNSGSDKPSDASFQLFEGHLELIDFWHSSSIDNQDKYNILAISPAELLQTLNEAGFNELDLHSQANYAKMQEIISNAQLISTFRRIFVDSMYAEGKISLDFGDNNISQANLQEIQHFAKIILTIFEKHITDLYTRHRILNKFLVILMFYTYSYTEIHWLLRYSLISSLIAVYSYQHSIPALKKAHNFLVYSYFDDFNSLRLANKYDNLFAIILSISCMTWITAKQYYFYSFLLYLPLIFAESEYFLLSSTQSHDRNALKLIRLLILFLAELIMLYFNYYSKLNLVFCVVFFLPSLTTFILTAVSLVLALVLPTILTLRGFLFDYNARKFVYWAVWAISALLFYYSRSSWLYFLGNLLMFALLLPSELISGLILLCAVGSSLLLHVGLVPLVILSIKLATALIFALILALYSKYLAPRLSFSEPSSFLSRAIQWAKAVAAGKFINWGVFHSAFDKHSEKKEEKSANSQ